MTISRLYDRVTGATISDSQDDGDLDQIINELNSHTAAVNPHTGSMAKAGDTITGEIQWGANGFLDYVKVRNHANYTGSELFEYTYSNTTADATETTLATIALSDLYHYRFEGEVTCYDGAGTEYGTFFIKYSAYRAGGNATECLTNQVDTKVSTSTMWAAFDCNSTNVRLRVVGKAGTNLYWAGTVRYQAVKTNA